MCRKSLSGVLITLFILGVLLQVNTIAQNKINVANKIAFFRDQAVWLANADGTGEMKLTNDTLKVNEFLFSPSLRYLACTIVVGSEKDWGLVDSTETPGQREVYSIIVLDLQTNKIVKKIDDSDINIDSWLPHNRLLYFTASAGGIDGFYAYDPVKDLVIEMPHGNNASGYDFISDGQRLVAYLGNNGRNLHLHFIDTNRDTVLVSRKNPMYDVQISNNTKYISFLEDGSKEEYEYSDNLWLYSRQNSTCALLYKGPVHDSGFQTNCVWSPDDKHICMFLPYKAVVVEVENPSNSIIVGGWNFNWVANDKIFFSIYRDQGQDSDAYVFDLKTSSRKLIIRNAFKVVYLR